jgi:hypothetical protein
MSSAPILPAVLTQIVDQAIQFVYSFEHLVAPTVVLGTSVVETCAFCARLMHMVGCCCVPGARIGNARFLRYSIEH